MTRILAVTALLLTSANAWAYLCTRVPDNGPSVQWEARTVGYRLHETCSADIADTAACLDALRASFQPWTDIDCSDFRFEDQGTTADARTGYDWRRPQDAINTVVFREGNEANPLDGWTHQRGALAITTVTFNSRTGKILDADIEVNGAPNGTREYKFQLCDATGSDCGDNDLRNTITHEAGHALGLDHPPPTQPLSSEATMFASAPSGEIKKRDLSQDDLAGVCNIYPTGAANAPCIAPATSEGANVTFKQLRACDDTSSSPCNSGCQGPQFLTLGAVGILLRRKKRR